MRQELQELIYRAKHEEVFLYAAGIGYIKPAKFVMRPTTHSKVSSYLGRPEPRMNVLQLKPVAGWVSLSLDAFNVELHKYTHASRTGSRFLFTNYWFALGYTTKLNHGIELRGPGTFP